MFKLLFIAYPFLELYIVVKFIDHYSFSDFFFLTLSSGILGLIIMSLQGRATLAALQKSLAGGQFPKSEILHRALIMLGGLLIFFPGIVNDVFGIFLILPGFRHLIAIFLKLKLSSAALRGSAKIFNSGFYAYSSGSLRSDPSVERDATVIDVTPTEIIHTKKIE